MSPGRYYLRARRSPVDGIWRAWTVLSARRLGLARDPNINLPDWPVQVCVGASHTKHGCLKDGEAALIRWEAELFQARMNSSITNDPPQPLPPGKHKTHSFEG